MEDFHINILTVTFRFKGYVLVEIMYKQIFSCRDIDMVDRATNICASKCSHCSAHKLLTITLRTHALPLFCQLIFTSYICDSIDWISISLPLSLSHSLHFSLFFCHSTCLFTFFSFLSFLSFILYLSLITTITVTRLSIFL